MRNRTVQNPSVVAGLHILTQYGSHHGSTAFARGEILD